MLIKIKRIFEKYKELIMYVIFGVLTTLVNFVSFTLFTHILGEDRYLINNAIAWFISVVFAYVTNKIFVFESKSIAPRVLIKEFSEFLLARVFSFALEEGGIWLLVDILNFGGYSVNVFGFNITGQIIAKLILAVIVVITNYVFSKFIVFAKKSK